MRSAWPIFTALALLLVALAAFVWASHHPAHPLLERAQSWTVLGPLAREIRRIYLPPEEPAAAPSPSPPVVIVIPPPQPVREPADAADSFTAPRDAADALVEPPLGDAPAPVLPVADRPADPDRLQQAIALLGADGRSSTLGPYRAWTDVAEPALVTRLTELAARIEMAYRERYELTVVGETTASVVLFANQVDYARFRDGEPRLVGLDSRGHTSRGIVALFAEGEWGDVEATLTHELAHLLNRRAIGPALPPWLDEGLAEDLAAATVRGPAWPAAQLRRRTKTGAGSRGSDLPQGSLPEILDADWDKFVSPERRSLHYAWSAAWIHFLMSADPVLSAGFKEFLAGVAAGGAVDAGALQRHLGYGWDDLERSFNRWWGRMEPGSGER